MTVRRAVLVAAIALGAFLGIAPTAHAKPAACAWVDPYGVCLSNPFEDLPKLPKLPAIPQTPAP
jgi:hypothetical protein